MHSYYFDRPDLAGEELPLPSAGGEEGYRFRPADGERPPLPPRRPPKYPRRPNRVRRRSAVVLCLFLVVLLGGSGTLLALGMHGLLPWSGMAAPPDFTYTAPEEGQEFPTTVERAPLGDGTVLTLRAAPGGAELSAEEIYAKNAPSIVSIESVLPDGISQGTGIVFSKDGYILTNHHVIAGASAVTVSQLDGSAHYNALLVGSDSQTDLAVLKVEDRTDFTPAEFGVSDTLRVGERAYAIGNPLGAQLPGTMTEGIISFLDRSMSVDGYEMELIQTDAALNSGNSGGALVNRYGQVVGVTTLKMMSDFDTIEGLGFAIPSATVKAIADELIARGHVGGRPTIGITAGPSYYYVEEGYDGPEGLYVVRVEPRSDAWAKGLRAGDIILRTNGRPTPTIEALNAVKEELGVGDTLELECYRDGEYRTITVALVEQYTLQP
ncbi:MAG: serine protease [Clostridiales bacterium]|nr:serine protease [Clostridiales bacterium]